MRAVKPTAFLYASNSKELLQIHARSNYRVLKSNQIGARSMGKKMLSVVLDSLILMSAIALTCLLSW